MWARMAEIVLAAWLAASRWVFANAAEEPRYWMSDVACAGLIALFAALSFRRPLGRMHLLEIPVALWLLGFGFLAHREPLPSLQNDVVVGLLLLMFAIVPSHATQPPESWQE